MPESPRYKAVGALGMELGLEWGGNWRTIVDQVHYPLCPAWAAGLPECSMLAELRKRKSLGEEIAGLHLDTPIGKTASKQGYQALANGRVP